MDEVKKEPEGKKQLNSDVSTNNSKTAASQTLNK
jgi:hypothetical protein